MKTVIELRQIEKPLTGKRAEFEVDGLKNIDVAEIYANLLASKHSASEGVPYYVHSVVMNSNNFVFNPTPDYWDLDRVRHGKTTVTELYPEIHPTSANEMSEGFRKKSVTF